MLTKRLIVTLSAVAVASLCGLTAGMANDDDRGGDGPPLAGGGHKGEGRPGGPGGPISDEHVDAIVEVLKDADPDYAVKVEKARKENPGAGQKLIGTMGPRLMQMVQLKKNDPDMYKLRIEEFKMFRTAETLSTDIRNAPADAKADPKIAAKEKELKELLSKLFDLRQQMREKELQRLEKKVVDLREGINRRKANKDSILAERYKEMTEKSVDKDW